MVPLPALCHFAPPGEGGTRPLQEPGAACITATDEVPEKAEAHKPREGVACNLVDRLHLVGGEPGRAKAPTRLRWNTRTSGSRIRPLPLAPGPPGWASCGFMSVIIAPLAVPGSAIFLVLVFHLDYLKCPGVDCRLDPAPCGIAAIDLVATVVDLDAAHRPAILFRQPCNGVSRLPVGHRHEAIVVR